MSRDHTYRNERMEPRDIERCFGKAIVGSKYGTCGVDTSAGGYAVRIAEVKIRIV